MVTKKALLEFAYLFKTKVEYSEEENDKQSVTVYSIMQYDEQKFCPEEGFIDPLNRMVRNSMRS